MPTYWKPACLASLAALAVSLAFHSRQLRARPPPISAAAPTAAQPARAPSSPFPSASLLGPAAPDACARDLEACRTKSWTLALDAIVTDARDRDVRAARDAGVTSANLEGSTLDDQRRALDEIARDHLRAQWTSEKSNILRSIRDVAGRTR